MPSGCRWQSSLWWSICSLVILFTVSTTHNTTQHTSQGAECKREYEIGMESGNSTSLHQELHSLRKSVRTAQCLTAALGVLVLALFIALIAVGASQGKRIKELRGREGLLDNPNVTFATNSGYRNMEGLTYGGSLFRGSGFWAGKTALPGELTDHAAVAVGDFVYIIGGADVNGNVTNQVLKYDPVLHTFTNMSSMPQPRYRFGATLLDNGKGDTIYVVGGRNGSIDSPTFLVKSVFIYNVPTNTWTVGPRDAPAFQSDTVAGSFGGKVYEIGGYDENYFYLNSTWMYDTSTITWSRLADMPTPRGDHMCVDFMNEIYVLGGYYDGGNVSNNNAFSNKMESFNPTTGVWTLQPDLLTARGDAAVAVLPGNRIMLIGGEGHYDNNATYKYPKHVNEVYYGDDQTWVQKAFIPTARFRTAAATVGGLTYVFGGADICTVPNLVCPALSNNEVFLDVDHPHVYMYLKNDAYIDNAPLTTYPL